MQIKVKNCRKNPEPSTQSICQEVNFYKPLEIDNIEEQVLKPNAVERIAEVALLPEIPA